MTIINYPGTVKDLTPGDIVEYQTFMGGTRRVTVTNVSPQDSEHRGGTFDGRLVGQSPKDATEIWGYGEQIQRVTKVGA